MHYQQDYSVISVKEKKINSNLFDEKRMFMMNQLLVNRFLSLFSSKIFNPT